MKKTDELKNPNSCLNRAADDEPLFVLRGKDVAAPAAIAEWIKSRISMGKNEFGDSQITEAVELAEKMEQYQAKLAEAAGGSNMENEGGKSADIALIDDLNQGVAQ